jgi:hypothetical protein
MRRMGLGVAAAAIAGVMGFGGTAQALPTYATLAVNNTLATANGITWGVSACTFNGTGGCNALVMYANGDGITLAAAPSGTPESFQPLSNLLTSTVTDFSVNLVEFDTAGSISSATLSAIGGTNGGTASIQNDTNPQAPTAIGTIGLPGSNTVGSISFTGVSTVGYNMDVPLTTTLVSVSFGAPVPTPEPASAALLAFGLLLTAVVSMRAVR